MWFLQICGDGFRVCKVKQTYVTLSHTLVPNHVPKKQEIYNNNKKTYKHQDLRVGVTQTSTLLTEPSP